MSSTVAPRDRSDDRLGEALQETARSPGRRPAAAQLVGDVARIEIREHQHVGAAGDRTRLLDLLGGNRSTSAASPCSSPSTARSGARSRTSQAPGDLRDTRMRRTALGREGEQGDARLLAKQAPGACAEAMAISASSSAVGSALTAQSAKPAFGSAPDCRARSSGKNWREWRCPPTGRSSSAPPR